MDKTRKKMSGLLKDKEVSAILGLRMNHGHPVPYLFVDPEELKDWTVDETNRYPLTKILIKIAKKHPDLVIGIPARGCEERSLIELFKNHQLKPDKVRVFGVACSQELANRCRCEKPYPSSLEEGKGETGGRRLGSEED